METIPLILPLEKSLSHNCQIKSIYPNCNNNPFNLTTINNPFKITARRNIPFNLLSLGATTKVNGSFGWLGPLGMVSDHNFRSKAFKTCKNTIKLFNLCALSCLGVVEYMTPADCDCVL